MSELNDSVESTLTSIVSWNLEVWGRKSAATETMWKLNELTKPLHILDALMS